MDMRLEIKGGKLKEIDEALDELIDIFEKEYKKSVEKAKNSKKWKMLGVSGRIGSIMPSEIHHLHFIEDGKVVLRNSLYVGGISKRAGMHKKIVEGVKDFLEYKGFRDIEVELVNDEIGKDKGDSGFFGSARKIFKF